MLPNAVISFLIAIIALVFQPEAVPDIMHPILYITVPSGT